MTNREQQRKILDRKRTILEDTDVKKIFKYYKKHHSEIPRRFLAFQIGLFTGMRISEIRHLKIEEVEKGLVYVTCKRRTREVYFEAELLRTIKQYCAENNISSGFIFRSSWIACRDKPLAASTLTKDFILLGKETKVDRADEQFRRGVTHNLRRFFCRKAIPVLGAENTAEVVGHSDPRVTQEYYRVSTREVKKMSHKMTKNIRKDLDKD